MLELLPLMHASKEFDADQTSQYHSARTEAKKPHNRLERQAIWQTIFGYEKDLHDPIIAEQERARDLRLTQLQGKVDRLPAAQATRETKVYAFDKTIAVDRTRIETMQMERSAGYPLHVNIPEEAEAGFDMEKRGWMSRTNWVHVSLLEQKLQQRERLDNTDLESAIAILHGPPTSSSVTNTTVLMLFRQMSDIPLFQQQKICEAVTPFLTSGDKWERKDAGAVLKKFGGSAPTPPPAQKAQAAPALPHQAALLKTAGFAAPADDASAGQTAPTAGVPTEADIAQARQHFHDLEKARADYIAVHPSTVSPMQTTEQEIAKTALRLQIIQLDKSMTVLGRQGQALRTPAVVAFEEKRHQREEQTYTDMDQIRSAEAKSILYPAQSGHWKQVSASASARLRRRQAEIQAMRPPTPEAAAEVARYDSYLKSVLAARRRWMRLDVTWYEKYAPHRAAGR